MLKMETAKLIAHRGLDSLMPIGKNDLVILLTRSNNLRNKISRDNSSGQKLRSYPNLRTGMSIFLTGVSSGPG